MKFKFFGFFAFCLYAASSVAFTAQPDRVLFDFESGTFDGWLMEGKETFGPAPFNATAEVRQWVEHRGFTGWQGKYIVIVGDTRHGITSPGRMTSDEFTITHRYLKFLYGGEVHPRVKVCLLLDGNPVRTAYGNNSYDMRMRGWDVAEFKGRKARIVVEDTCETASLVRLDYFHLSDTSAPANTGGAGRIAATRRRSVRAAFGTDRLGEAEEPGAAISELVHQGRDGGRARGCLSRLLRRGV